MKKLFIVIGVILSFLVVTSIQCLADDVIHACVNKKGKIRIVDDPCKCKKRETPRSWNVQGEPGPPGLGCIKVYDSSDPPQFLGILANMKSDDGFLTIYIPSLKRFIRLSGGEILGEGTGVGHCVWYEETGCPEEDVPFGGSFYYITPGQYMGLEAGHYYTAEDVLSPGPFLSRHCYAEDCEDLSFAAGLPAAKEVTLPFSEPIVQPFQFE
jgi:hypothetical protein